MADARYPIGKFQFPENPTSELRQQWLHEIEAAPSEIRAAAESLTAEQLHKPYRPGGWTALQVIHHVPDSHLNSYVRFRLALTEEEPLIKPYDEARWAQLPDAQGAPPKVSLSMLESLHQRWMILLRSLTPPQWQRTFRHPEMGVMNLEKSLALYAWHGKHHAAHIRQCAVA